MSSKFNSKYDLNYVVALEKAISEKYGELASINPRSTWNDEKENNYVELLRKTEQRFNKTGENELELYKIYSNKKNAYRVCEWCKDRAVILEDDLCLNKYGCCYKCYINKIEEKELIKNENSN